MEGQDLGPYPRVVLVGEGVKARSLPPAREVEVALEVLREVDVRFLANRLKGALPGAVGAIVNTVDRAQALYRAWGRENRSPWGNWRVAWRALRPGRPGKRCAGRLRSGKTRWWGRSYRARPSSSSSTPAFPPRSGRYGKGWSSPSSAREGRGLKGPSWWPPRWRSRAWTWTLTSSTRTSPP